MTKTLLFLVLTMTLVNCSPRPKVAYAKMAPEHKTFQIILMGGQSNMVGAGRLDDLEPMAFDNVSYVDFGRNANLEKPQDRFGPEVGLSQVLNKHFPEEKFLLIKYAVGGASLLDWAPDYDPEKARITGHPEFGPLYQKMMAKVDSITRGLDHKMVALLWMQGERDARIPEAGVDYHTHFTHLITSFRNDLESPELPILFGQVNPPKSRYPALDTVVAAQMKVAQEVDHSYLIETQDLEKWADSVHYSSKGQLQLGNAFGTQLRALLAD